MARMHITKSILACTWSIYQFLALNLKVFECAGFPSICSIHCWSLVWTITCMSNLVTTCIYVGRLAPVSIHMYHCVRHDVTCTCIYMYLIGSMYVHEHVVVLLCIYIYTCPSRETMTRHSNTTIKPHSLLLQDMYYHTLDWDKCTLQEGKGCYTYK